MKGIFYQTEATSNNSGIHICILKKDLKKDLEEMATDAISALATYLHKEGDLLLPVQKDDGQFFIVNEKGIASCGNANLYEEDEYFLLTNLPWEMAHIKGVTSTEAARDLKQYDINYQHAIPTYISITIALSQSYLPALRYINVGSM